MISLISLLSEKREPVWSPASGSDEPWTKDKRLEDAKGKCKWKVALHCSDFKQTCAIARMFQASSLPKHLLTSYIFLQSWSCPACGSGNEAWHMLKDVQSLLAARDMGSRNAVVLYPSEHAPKYKFPIAAIAVSFVKEHFKTGTYIHAEIHTPIHPHPPTVLFTLSFC